MSRKRKLDVVTIVDNDDEDITVLQEDLGCGVQNVADEPIVVSDDEYDSDDAVLRNLNISQIVAGCENSVVNPYDAIVISDDEDDILMDLNISQILKEANASDASSSGCIPPKRARFSLKRPLLCHLPQFRAPSCDGGECSKSVTINGRNAFHSLPTGDRVEDVQALLEEDAHLLESVNLEPGTVAEITALPHYSESLRVLRNVFHLQEFRGNQAEIVDAALERKDVMVVMATGGGKSLCFQVPAVMDAGLTVVIAPVTSLIVDQMKKLRNLNIRVESSQAGVQLIMALKKKECDVKLVYVTPEYLVQSVAFKSLLQELNMKRRLSRFVFDEAHCIVQWGETFRHAYKGLHWLRNSYPNVPMMVVTASATLETREGIQRLLGLQNPRLFISTINRTNLKYDVVPKSKLVMPNVVSWIKCNFPSASGIVYCLSKKECEIVSITLRKAGISAAAYHAGMTQGDRFSVQSRWMENKVQIIVATVAFGMGIDKPDVRFVIHLDIPKSVESYYQECGRAGRDGQESRCLLYYSFDDALRYLSLGNEVAASSLDNFLMQQEDSQSKPWEKVMEMVSYCMNINACRRVQLMHFFSEQTGDVSCEGSTACDVCSKERNCSTEDVTEIARVLVQALQGIQENHDPIGRFVDVLKGYNNAKTRDSVFCGSHLHGMLSSWNAGKIRTLVEQLVSKQLFGIIHKRNMGKYSAYYLKAGCEAAMASAEGFVMSLTVVEE